MNKVLAFEPGWTVTWVATTQAAFNICLTMTDLGSQTKFVDKACRQDTRIGVMSNGTYQLAASKVNGAGDVSVTITSSGGHPIQWRESQMSCAPGGLVARGYLCLGEDYTDNDFNDVYLSIMGWKSTG